MLLNIGKLIRRAQDSQLERLMRTEFARDYHQIRKMNNGHVDARAYLEMNMDPSSRR